VFTHTSLTSFHADTLRHCCQLAACRAIDPFVRLCSTGVAHGQIIRPASDSMGTYTPLWLHRMLPGVK
jgi:hypothetical protein